MNERINGRPSDFKKYCEKQGVLDVNNDIDRYAIGIHLYRENGLTMKLLINTLSLRF